MERVSPAKEIDSSFHRYRRKESRASGWSDSAHSPEPNIVQPETTDLPISQLARAIADETGETLTRAVTESLRERYERIRKSKGKASVDELLAIAQRVAKRVKKPYLDHAELLYDKHGLPK